MEAYFRESSFSQSPRVSLSANDRIIASLPATLFLPRSLRGLERIAFQTVGACLQAIFRCCPRGVACKQSSTARRAALVWTRRGNADRLAERSIFLRRHYPNQVLRVERSRVSQSQSVATDSPLAVRVESLSDELGLQTESWKKEAQIVSPLFDSARRAEPVPADLSVASSLNLVATDLRAATLNDAIVQLPCNNGPACGKIDRYLLNVSELGAGVVYRTSFRIN